MPVIIWHFMLCMGVAVVIHVASAANYASAIILRCVIILVPPGFFFGGLETA
jgi:hypothetical protein